MVLRSHLIAEEWDFNISQDVVDAYCLSSYLLRTSSLVPHWGTVGIFTVFFIFIIIFFYVGGNLCSLCLYLLENFFAIPDYVLCKAVRASSEQGTDYFQILLPQEYCDNKIRPGVLKRFSILFQGD